MPPSLTTLSQLFEKFSRSKYSTFDSSQTSINHFHVKHPSRFLSTFLHVGLSFVVLGAPLWYPSLGPYSRFPLALVCGPMLASVLWFPMAHPLVSNGPSSGSQWPILRFPMAHPLVPHGPSFGSQWPVLCGPSPGYLSRAPCGPRFGSGPSPRIACSLIFNSYYPICPRTFISFLFTHSFLVVVYISSRTCILIL